MADVALISNLSCACVIPKVPATSTKFCESASDRIYRHCLSSLPRCHSPPHPPIHKTTADKKRKLTVNDIPDIDHTLGLLTEWRARHHASMTRSSRTLARWSTKRMQCTLPQPRHPEVVENAGGKFGGSINGKTTIVVIGALEEWSKKAADSGPARQRSSRSSRTGARKADNLHIVLFKDFINHFSLDTSSAALCARYRRHELEARPGKRTLEGHAAGLTLGRNDPTGKLVGPRASTRTRRAPPGVRRESAP